jgi:hypothetical protein
MMRHSLTFSTDFDTMWDEIQDMPGEIFDLDIDDREMMPLDMQEDIEQEDPLTWREDS